jgi:hypothetical protein
MLNRESEKRETLPASFFSGVIIFVKATKEFRGDTEEIKVHKENRIGQKKTYF